MNKTVSITIPCRNEELYIEKCVVSLLENSYPNKLITIYVCDGLSDDKTRDIVKKISEKHDNVLLLDNKKKTTPYALNIGLKKSRADIKIILGAHSEVDKDFIKESVHTFERDEEIGCVGGVLENIYENSISEIIGIAMSSPFGVGNAHFRTGAKDGYVDTVAFGAYKSEIFEKIGYFDESLTRNQDDEFNFRVIKNGFKIFLSKKIKCKYYVRGSFKKLYRQYYQYGYWKVFVNKKHRTVTSIRQLIPLFFVLFVCIGGGLSFIHHYILYVYFALCSIYILMAILYAFKATKNITHTPQIIYSFLILHISYGSGYLLGIIDFLLLNKNPNKNEVKMSR